MTEKSYRIDGLYTLLAPMSHIGESHSTDSYLSTVTVIGPDRKPVECAQYSGNAMRGVLRDKGAEYLLNKLGQLRVPLPAFHLLFSGGSIGGDQSIDTDQARAIRAMMPHVSIFGGGVGNQILDGKLRIGPLWPICYEAQRFIPAKYQTDTPISWRQMTTEQSFTRRDDGKSENLRKYIADESQLAIEGDVSEKGEKKKKDPPTQMRYTVEALAPGAQLYGRMDIGPLSEVELGAFVAAIVEWAKHPYIGGKSGVGYGLVDAEFRITPEDGEEQPFISVNSDTHYSLSAPAQKAKEAYDQHLKSIYDQYVLEHKDELVHMLTAGMGAK